MYKDMVTRVQSGSLSTAVRDELIRLITTAVLKPGDRLNEVHLAEQLGVSRGPVREAARELEGLGLTISRPRQGFYVADYSDAEIIDIYEVGAWVGQAVVHDFMTYSDLAARREILADIATISRASTQAFSETLLAFRQRFVAQIHNRYLAEHALSLYRRYYIVAALIRAEDAAGRIARIIDTQQALWSAMAADDRALAERIMAEDAAYWIKDVPPRFHKSPSGDRPEGTQENPSKDRTNPVEAGQAGR